MKFNRSINTWLIATLAMLPLASMAGKNDSQKQQSKKQWLLVQSAQKAHIKALEGKKDHYQLILKNVHPVLYGFTDRPYRQTTVINNQQYLKMWDTSSDSFKQNPPNIAIDYMKSAQGKSSDHMKTVIFEATQQPKYNQSQGTMTYHVKALSDEKIKTKTFHDVGVFIDNMTAIY